MRNRSNGRFGGDLLVLDVWRHTPRTLTPANEMYTALVTRISIDEYISKPTCRSFE